ncbi:MFS transporter [Verrucomicrobium sp. BvORR034]|uniref:MFS transporter n=1 Tax=Verrucomicrobium sp. BvORR034 TaxID=1396418 RepID=UPI000678545F|nr:MFS transporter [Verrucomicrobium sp. BvORR034]
MSSATSASPSPPSALDRARKKAFYRIIPLLFISYMIAYVDRQNVAVAKLTMTKDLVGFTDAVIGFGAGIFFIGYFLLEIPGSLIVEKWGARRWISRIMVTWGIMAALTAAVHTPVQFYTVRFLLGLAEAGFFPGVIVYLTHWFTDRDRSKALAMFLVATPFAQMVSPKISYLLLKIGTTEVVNGQTITHPLVLGMTGWQWVYVFWGIPAVMMGLIVFFIMKDRPRQASWLTDEEKEALESELERERAVRSRGKRMKVTEALRHPKVLLMAWAYFSIVTCSYSIEFFMPSVLNDWYHMNLNTLTWLIILPPALALVGQLVGGWSSDHFQERRLHACLPIVVGATALACAPMTQGNLPLTVACFMIGFAGFKTYMPAFWSLPSTFLTQAAAAGSIGLINSFGNLGGALGPYIMGKVKTVTGSFVGGLYFISCSMLLSAIIIYFLGLGVRKKEKEEAEEQKVLDGLPEK